MITRLTKIQLIVFAIVTLIGGAFVGGRYAQIDRLVVDRTYPVTAQFSDSGGIFAGAQVTYRGIPVGDVGSLKFTDSGVQVTLDIENDAPKIPADSMAVVANKSAIGEQYVDLQPNGSSGPYLQAGSNLTLDRTRIPIDTSTLLINVDSLVSSIDTENLRTVVSELGQAFQGTGDDLSTILDTSNSFITTAQENIPVTRALIRDSASVLQTQIDKQSALSTFSKNLALLSDELVVADPDIRRLLDEGTDGARTVRTVVDENAEDLTVSINDLVTTSKTVRKNLLGLQAIFVLYPFLIQGSYSVVQPSDVDEGEYDATFGLVTFGGLPPNTPAAAPCGYYEDGGSSSGYRERRDSANLTDVPLDTEADCKVADNGIVRQPSDPDKVSFNRAEVASARGEDSWTWLMLDPVAR